MSKTPSLALVIAASGLVTALPVQAVFIIETNGTLGSSNFAYTGGAGGTARTSSTSSSPGLLPAVADGTFFTYDHVFGGTVAPHQYTFTYSPASDPDNHSFTVGTDYNLPQGLESSGLAGGTAGIYNVYRITQANPGVTAGNTTLYEVFVNGGLEASETVDQNAADLAAGENIGRWELIGSVSVFNASDTVSVTMTPSTDGFVSMRAHGMMFEYVAPIPEPGITALAGLGLLGLLRRRR